MEDIVDAMWEGGAKLTCWCDEYTPEDGCKHLQARLLAYRRDGVDLASRFWETCPPPPVDLTDMKDMLYYYKTNEDYCTCCEYAEKQICEHFDQPWSMFPEPNYMLTPVTLVSMMTEYYTDSDDSDDDEESKDDSDDEN